LQPQFDCDDFKSKYNDNTPVYSTSNANNNNKLVSRYTDNGGSIKSDPEANENFDESPIRI
jgi:hypothetical protein